MHKVLTSISMLRSSIQKLLFLNNIEEDEFDLRKENTGYGGAY